MLLLPRRATDLGRLGDAVGRSFTAVEFQSFDGWSGLDADSPTGWLPPDRQAAFLKNCVFTECAFTGLLTGVRFERCRFVRCTFHLDVRHVEFFACEFVGCNLSWAAFENCKMKFSRFTDNTFGYTGFLRCDLYRSTFFRPSNTFSEATFALVSISRVDLEGTTGINRRSFFPGTPDQTLVPGPDVPNLSDREAKQRRERALAVARPHPPLIQESEAEYRRLLGQTNGMTSSLESTLNRRLAEAAGVWRTVSGACTASGNYRDAAWAYVHAKRLERQDANPLRTQYISRGEDGNWKPGRRWNRLGSFVVLVLADALCGFGNAYGRILLWLGGLTVLFAGLLTGYGAVTVAKHAANEPARVASLFQSWEYAVGQLADSPPGGLAISSVGWQVAASIETLLGIALVGLFGFVVANRIRFD